MTKEQKIMIAVALLRELQGMTTEDTMFHVKHTDNQIVVMPQGENVSEIYAADEIMTITKALGLYSFVSAKEGTPLIHIF